MQCSVDSSRLFLSRSRLVFSRNYQSGSTRRKVCSDASIRVFLATTTPPPCNKSPLLRNHLRSKMWEIVRHFATNPPCFATQSEISRGGLLQEIPLIPAASTDRPKQAAVTRYGFFSSVSRWWASAIGCCHPIRSISSHLAPLSHSPPC